MIFTKLTMGLGAATLFMAATTVYFRMEAKLQKQKAEIAEANYKAVKIGLEAIASADRAVSEKSNELVRAARIAAKALNEAREKDATLDACLRYDPGVDITGGLFNDAVPASP